MAARETIASYPQCGYNSVANCCCCVFCFIQLNLYLQQCFTHTQPVDKSEQIYDAIRSATFFICLTFAYWVWFFIYLPRRWMFFSIIYVSVFCAFHFMCIQEIFTLIWFRIASHNIYFPFIAAVKHLQRDFNCGINPTWWVIEKIWTRLRLFFNKS